MGFKRNKPKCNFHYEANACDDVTDLKPMDFTKTQKFRYLKIGTLTFLQMKKIINCTTRATLLKKNSSAVDVTFNNKKIPCITPLYHYDKFVCDFKEKSKMFNNYFA